MNLHKLGLLKYVKVFTQERLIFLEIMRFAYFCVLIHLLIYW